MEAGGRETAILNAANEVAVQAFLDGRIGFTAICGLVEAALEAADFDHGAPSGLDDIIALNESGRSLAWNLVSKFALT